MALGIFIGMGGFEGQTGQFLCSEGCVRLKIITFAREYMRYFVESNCVWHICPLCWGLFVKS